MMRRRLAGLFSCMLVLTFSSSGSRVCNDMAHGLGAQATAHAASGMYEHHGHAPADSHRPADHRAPLDHCPSASPCASVLLVADAAVQSIDSPHNDGIVQVAELEPSSESTDLEPPPP